MNLLFLPLPLPLSLCAISLADVIVSPAGVLSGTEVGASERV